MRAAIRRAATEDLTAVVLLRERVAAEGLWLGTEATAADRPEVLANLAARLDVPNAVLLVAEVDGTIVGFLSCEHRRGLADLGMFVDGAHRGHGIGGLLLDAAIAWARDEHCHKLTLEVWPHNERARRLYVSAGFVDEGRFRRQYRRRNGELWDSVAMGLVLDEESPGSPHGGADVAGARS